MPNTTTDTAAEDAQALETLVDDLADVTGAIQAFSLSDLPGVSGPALATIAARLQDAAAALRTAESHLTAELGNRHGAGVMDLLDGRQATLKRTAERKEWDHDEWKRDARRAVAKRLVARYDVLDEGGLPTVLLVDVETGEEATLGQIIQEAMLGIQEVHGSAEPKSTALKPLGLFKADYCTSSPAGWRLTTLRAEPTTPTTIEETPTDA